MEPFFADNMGTLYNGDARNMAELPDESVQMCVTSPPYWGLRKYSGVPDLIWGGDEDCQHEWVSKKHKDTRGVGGSNLTGRIPYTGGEARINYTDGFCSLCGAWKGSYGLEPHPDCGRPFMKLRDDLAPKEKEYVLSELRKFGAI